MFSVRTIFLGLPHLRCAQTFSQREAHKSLVNVRVLHPLLSAKLLTPPAFSNFTVLGIKLRTSGMTSLPITTKNLFYFSVCPFETLGQVLRNNSLFSTVLYLE